MPVLGNQEFRLLVETAEPITDPANSSEVRCETKRVLIRKCDCLTWVDSFSQQPTPCYLGIRGYIFIHIYF